jgi:hypothetical protein
MNATQFEQSGLSYFDRPPILISATSEAALALATRSVEGSGCRIDTGLLDTAKDRIERQIAATAVWIELDRDGGDQMDELLDCVARNARDGRFAAVVSATSALIDPIAAKLDGSPVEVVVDADEATRATALPVAFARAAVTNRLSDVASDQSAARLRQLSDEVSRIAATLARLSSGPAPAIAPIEPAVRSDAPEVSIETVRSVIRARRLRSRFFPEDLFADPAWDMLLDLLQAEIAHLRVPVSSLCIAAAVPATTALRWLKAMVSQGLFIRRADPHDGRRVFVELAPDASRALRRYFAEVGRAATI